MSEQNVSPEMQFQVGEPVLYVPQGIYTTVTGYNWMQQMNGPPRLVGYQLSCGIQAPFKDLRRPPEKELTKPSESV